MAHNQQQQQAADHNMQRHHDNQAKFQRAFADGDFEFVRSLLYITYILLFIFYTELERLETVCHFCTCIYKGFLKS